VYLLSYFLHYTPEIIHQAFKIITQLDYCSCNYIKYIGAGAVVFGGILSLIKSLPLIARTFKEALGGLKSTSGEISHLELTRICQLRVHL